MSRKWTMLTLVVSLCSSGTLQANPLDSPDTVYIDGLPCSSACQSYMAWSHRSLSARPREEPHANVAVPIEPEVERIERGTRPHVARHPALVSRSASHGVMAPNSKPSNVKKAAASNPAHQATGQEIPKATVTRTRQKALAVGQAPGLKPESSDRPEPVQGAAIAAPQPAQEAKPEVKSEVVLPPPATLEIATPPATSKVAALPAAADGSLAPAPRTIQQQVVEATGMADLVTAIGTGRQEAGKSNNPATEPGQANDTDRTASPAEADNRVALLLARPEINSLFDLNNKNVAIEERQSELSGMISAALMAEGAAEVQFSEGQARSIDRLVSGEVPAAVLTLASPEAADGFPDIAGYKIFRIPLKGRL